MKYLKYASIFLISLIFTHAFAEPVKTLDEPVPTACGNKKEVVELFWYGCPHCYEFEPTLEEWVKKLPKDACFRRIPAVFNNVSWSKLAQLYYTLETLGQVEKLHFEVFKAIQEQNINLLREEVLLDWVKEHGIDPQQFKKTYESFTIAQKVEHAKKLTRAYGIDGVPALVVQGRYVIVPEAGSTYGSMLRQAEKLLQKASSTSSAQ
jgi:thiol:disulfide interchange protein DsbA